LDFLIHPSPLANLGHSQDIFSQQQRACGQGIILPIRLLVLPAGRKVN